MEQITNISDDNLGGLQALDFIPLWQVAKLFPLTFYEGFGWIRAYCTPETMQFEEATGTDANGTFQNVAISGSIPKIRPEAHAVLNRYQGKPCLVRTTDQNGALRLAGLTKGRIELSVQSTTGNAVADLNGYTIKFTGKQLLPALFLPDEPA